MSGQIGGRGMTETARVREARERLERARAVLAGYERRREDARSRVRVVRDCLVELFDRVMATDAVVYATEASGIEELRAMQQRGETIDDAVRGQVRARVRAMQETEFASCVKNADAIGRFVREWTEIQAALLQTASDGEAIDAHAEVLKSQVALALAEAAARRET